MEIKMDNMIDFLNSAHSSYHAVDALKRLLEAEGYTQLRETQPWVLQSGGKYYLIRGGNALIAFRIPHGTPCGFLMSACHSDRPTFKVKENCELTGQYIRLATEKYGGMLISTWLDRPLSIAGRVLIETERGIENCLLDIDRDLLLIPNVAIHMNRKANEGCAWNPAVDTIPLVGGEAAQGKLWSLLKEIAGGKILGHDLYLYVRQKASVWGVNQEYLSSAALDDLACAWCCIQGFLSSADSDAIPMLCIFDSEEVGSSSVQGAGSRFLEDTVSRVSKALGLDSEQILSRSFMISADNAHALHPNHPEYADSNNAPVLNNGVVLKFNANLRYTTDGLSAAVFRKICERAGVPVQTYYNRADLPGGSTLGCVSLAHVSVPTADIGLPQLAMHSSYETVGIQDIQYLISAIQTYYSSAIEMSDDGVFTLV